MPIHDKLPLKLSPSVGLRPCDADMDGPFIRDLTKSNFHDVMKRTVGWNEARHQQEPKHPECYQMVCRERQRVGFLSLRDEPQFVYLPTIQLVPDARASGIGTLLMQHVEHVAVEREYDRVRLRVFKGNPAKSLYDRLGYVVVESDDFSYVMEKKLRS